MFVRRVIREFLSSNGHIVLEAGDGAEALHLSERYKGPIHLLLTDVVLPRTCGRELVEHLEPLHPKTKIPYMSGYTNDTIFRHNALEQGAAFLQKSFTLGNLARKVREVLDAREKL